MNKGARLLKEWKTGHGLSVVEMASDLVCHQGQLYAWLAGSQRPRLRWAHAIAVYTGGAVPEGSWMEEEGGDAGS